MRIDRLLPPLCFALLATSALGGQSPASRTGGPRPGIDVLHYTFRVEFPDAAFPDTVRFVATTQASRTSAVGTLELDLAASMRVDSVNVNASSARFRRAGDSVLVTLPPGERDTLQVAVFYRGMPSDGLIIQRDSSLGWTAFGDNFPDRARQWLAVVDHPADKALVTWDVLAPATHRVIANGALLDETPDAAPSAVPRVRTRYEVRRPIYTSVMVIGVAPFAVVNLGDSTCTRGEQPGCVRQSVWVPPSQRNAIPTGFSRANEIVVFFSRLVGPFPYEKLAHVSSATRYGGMENAGAIFYASSLFKPGGDSESLVAHEIAHQWFGDAVTVREWPHVWLSEGFATYFAALWTQHAHGEGAFRDDLRKMRATVLNAPVTTKLPVIDEQLDDLGRVLNSNVYQKAGFVLHMLRTEIGDSAFFGGIRAYYAAHRHGNVVTADVQDAFETAAGRKLDWFFDQWMRRPGVADVTTSWRWDAARRAVIVTVVQRSAKPYRLWLMANVHAGAYGATLGERMLVPAQRTSTITLGTRLDTAPVAVSFDDDVTLLGNRAFVSAGSGQRASVPVVVAGAWTTDGSVHTVDGAKWSGVTPANELLRAGVQLFNNIDGGFARNNGTSGAFPLLVHPTRVTGRSREVLSTDFKLIGGASDQNAGIMFGLQPNGDYHYVRYNTKDGDLALWVFENGERRLIVHGTGHRQLALGEWHRLRVTLNGRAVSASVDGVPELGLRHRLDAPVQGPAGLWVKRDAVTAFRGWRAEIATAGGVPR
ncbi:MAG TPA: M1 family aminopeptidase [Gemmatimonadaceae bacterium]|nr:M1 family aminopeptidase [Gemmatimonadaceae bacterium]